MKIFAILWSSIILTFHADGQPNLSFNSESLPYWIANHADVLPPVSAAIRQEVANIWKDIRANARGLGEKPSPLFVQAAARFVAMGEIAGQAMVWDYLEEPELFDPAKARPDEREYITSILVSNNGSGKHELLMKLSDDPTLVKWLLPMLRVRMGWLEKTITEGKINETISISELGGISAYLNCQGTDQDLERLDGIIRSVAKAGYFPQYFATYPSLAEQASEIANIRRITKLHARPYFTRFLTSLPSTESGVIASPAKRVNEVPNADSSPSSVIELRTIPVTSNKDSSRWITSIIILAVITLLWQFLKKQTW